MATYKSLPEVDIIDQPDSNTNIIVEQNGELNRLNINYNNLNPVVIDIVGTAAASANGYYFDMTINDILYNLKGSNSASYLLINAGSSFNEIYNAIINATSLNITFYDNAKATTITSDSLTYQTYDTINQIYLPLINLMINSQPPAAEEPT